MLIVRTALSIGLVLLGAILIVRMASFGLRTEIVPGMVLGLAMTALGVHRLSLIARSRGLIR